MMLELLEKLIDRALSLIREREARGVTFFREVVDPIHKVFEQFKDEHIATFKGVLAILHDPHQDAEAAYRLVSDNERFESASWFFFERLEELKVELRNKVSEPYSEYIQSIQSCLRSISEDPTAPTSIAYYSGLLDELRLVTKLVAENTPNPRPRVVAIERVNELLGHFQAYCAEVEVAYLKLRKAVFV